MNIRHHYIDQGSGKPLILLHGNGQNGGYFKKQIAFFSEYYHVYAPDTRGHGRTPRGEKPFTIRQFADDLLKFMDDLGIRRAHILGFSDGGNIAMVFALAYPERVDRLILNGANMDTGGVRGYIQFAINLGYRLTAPLSSKSAFMKKNHELFGLMVNDPNVTDEALRQMKATTLVIAGTYDLVTAAESRRIAADIPNAELCFLRGTHFIAGTNAKEFNARVLRFLRQKTREEDAQII